MALVPRRSKTAANPVELHVVSDSTGETAARLVLALEAQFPDQPFVEVRHPRVESVQDLARAVSKAKGRPAVIVYTLVKPEWREAMRSLCRSARVHYCDLLGHPIDSVRRVSGTAARMTPGTRAALNETYFKRIEAIEFAVKYDDGVGTRGLDEADVVLVGVSRTSKTPLSMYLGYLGHKVANVPIVKGIAPPPELFKTPPEKIVGLTIDAERLAEIRHVRARAMGASKHYAELIEVYEELDEAAKVHRRLGCPVIDVSDLSIEETAARIVRIVDDRREAAAV
jgi:regulator of PEP synthase PpsR (kinase-PPPase family)